MKTQDFGIQSIYTKHNREPSKQILSWEEGGGNIIVGSLYALLHYRAARENGRESDTPNFFGDPSSVFGILLDINYTDWHTSIKYPDKQGRYWLKLTLKDGSTHTHFYWMEDRVRGWPDNDNRYWFSIHHGPSNTSITGFSQEPDYEKGFPNSADGNYYYHIQFSDKHCFAIRRWMEEKDFNYLNRIRAEDIALFEQDLIQLSAINPYHLAISKLAFLFVNEDLRPINDNIRYIFRSLDFSHKQLKDEQLGKLISLIMALPSLEEFILDFNLITKFGLENLLINLSTHPKLRSLSLRGNRIDEQNKQIFENSYIYRDSFRELFFRKDPDEGSKNGGFKVDLSLNFMTSALSDTALSGTYKFLLLTLLSVLITLNRPLKEIEGIQLKSTNSDDETGYSYLEFIQIKDMFLRKERILKKNLDRLRNFRMRISPDNPPEISEISNKLLGGNFSMALADFPTLSKINLKNLEGKDEKEIFAKQKATTKQLLYSHPDTPLKYLLSHHTIFRHTRISSDIKLPSLLMPEFNVSTERWVVYLMIKKDDNHASLAWEGLYRHGQRCFERAHLTAEVQDRNFIGHVIDEARLWGGSSGRKTKITNYPPAIAKGGLSRNPGWFEYACEIYHIIPVYATKQQIKKMVQKVKNEINGIDAEYLHRLSITRSSSSTKKSDAEKEPVQNCITWATDKINHFLELPEEHQITGTGVTYGNLYSERTHEQVLKEFTQRCSTSSSKNSSSRLSMIN